MADNVSITPGAGNVVAADEVTDGTLGQVKVQFIKLMDGTLDSTNKAVIDATGDVQVDVNNFPASQTVNGIVTANAGTGTFLVDGSAHTQPVSGTFFQATQPVSAASLPLPTGAATEATLSSLNGKVTVVNTGAVTISTALPAGTNVIGHAITDSGSTTAVTGNVTVIQPVGSSLHTVVDSGTVALSGTSSISGTVTSNQGTPTTLSNGWPVELSDGTNLLGVVAHPVRVDPTGITTQPVSGTVTANAGSGTFAISAASLPLPSGAATSANQATAQTTLSTIATNTTNAGTPTVTGTVTANAGTNLNTSALALDSTLTGGSQQTKIVQGGNTAIIDATGDLQVDVNNFPATQNIAGTVTSNQGTPSSSANRWPVQLTDGTDLALVSAAGALLVDGSAVVQPVSGIVTVQQATSASLNATVTQQAITKGTQGSTGVTTQDLKDAGRTFVSFTIDRIAGVAAEALATFTANKGGSVSSGTSYTVTAGKTLRIQSFSISVADTTTTAVNGRVRLRSAASVIATSPILAMLDASNSTGTALAGAGDDLQLPFPDGLEVAGGQQVGISQILSSTSSTLTVCVVGYEY